MEKFTTYEIAKIENILGEFDPETSIAACKQITPKQYDKLCDFATVLQVTIGTENFNIKLKPGHCYPRKQVFTPDSPVAIEVAHDNR